MLFRGSLAITGCVLLAGASIAETPQLRGHEKKSDGTMPPHVRGSVASSKLDKWSMTGHVNPYVGKQETKDLLRAKRPK